jgi:hypothetical protein
MNGIYRRKVVKSNLKVANNFKTPEIKLNMKVSYFSFLFKQHLNFAGFLLEAKVIIFFSFELKAGTAHLTVRRQMKKTATKNIRRRIKKIRRRRKNSPRRKRQPIRARR